MQLRGEGRTAEEEEHRDQAPFPHDPPSRLSQQRLQRSRLLTGHDPLGLQQPLDAILRLFHPHFQVLVLGTQQLAVELGDVKRRRAQGTGQRPQLQGHAQLRHVLGQLQAAPDLVSVCLGRIVGGEDPDALLIGGSDTRSLSQPLQREVQRLEEIGVATASLRFAIGLQKRLRRPDGVS
eukprot:scaffold1798_cov248-Pinguiococcus_pyrenoidosus.AAC.6